MITVRKGSDRGHFKHGWLDTYHTFSFADYHDPAQMGFRALRVINEDRVAPGQGFPTHSHRDMEIITYVLKGTVEHKDNMGNSGQIRPGEVQRMSAGTGVTHSEFNPSPKEPLHLLQIWILPEAKGLKSGYEQKNFPEAKKKNKWCLVASHSGREGSVKINQDAELRAAVLDKGSALDHTPAASRHAWLQVARGIVTLNGSRLEQGDGAAASFESRLTVQAEANSEILLFDLG